jgi:hypothetical protein
MKGFYVRDGMSWYATDGPVWNSMMILWVSG